MRRIPKRGIYDREEIYAILDKECVCHVSFVFDGYPVIIPTIYGRKDDRIYLHGATTSRMLQTLSEGIPICIAVTIVNGLVMARSTFNSSMNYESVVIFGKGRLLESNEEKLSGLEVVTEQIAKGRWEEARKPYPNELKATSVIEVVIEEASAKKRTGPVGEEKADEHLDIWAGIVPIEKHYGVPERDVVLREDIPMSDAITQLIEKKEDK